MSDIDRKIDELLAKYQIGFVVGDKDVNEHIAKFKQALLALINEAREDEIVRVLQQPYISAHLYGQARIAQLKPDTTLEGGK